MPNWCTTDYTVKGPVESLDIFHAFLHKMKETAPPVKNGFGDHWLGTIVDAFGGDYRKVPCRGHWEDSWQDEEGVHFSTITAWAPATEVIGMMRERWPDLRFLFYAEEPGCEYYATNDCDGEAYPFRWKVEISKSYDIFDEFFDTLDEALGYIGRTFGIKPPQNQQDVLELDASFEDPDGDWCNLHEISIVDDDGVDVKRSKI